MSADITAVPDRKLAARVRELSDRLKQTTKSSRELASKVAEGIRQERRAGLPSTPSQKRRRDDE